MHYAYWKYVLQFDTEESYQVTGAVETTATLDIQDVDNSAAIVNSLIAAEQLTAVDAAFDEVYTGYNFVETIYVAKGSGEPIGELRLVG